jgi:predicted transcriptional regulator
VKRKRIKEFIGKARMRKYEVLLALGTQALTIADLKKRLPEWPRFSIWQALKKLCELGLVANKPYKHRWFATNSGLRTVKKLKQ